MFEVPEICPVCAGTIRVRDGDRDIHVGQRTVTVRSSQPTCEQCGEVFFSPADMDALQQRASDEIRARERLLSPEAIRAVRNSLGLTQSQFEALLNVGAKTVVRWERGTVFQNPATDTLIRVIRDVPAAVHYLAQQRGVAVTPFSRTWHLTSSIPQSSPVPNLHYFAADEARETPVLPLPGGRASENAFHESDAALPSLLKAIG